jgi:hypothetical protein
MTVEYTCPTCGATYELRQISTLSKRSCGNCGRTIDPAEVERQQYVAPPAQPRPHVSTTTSCLGCLGVLAVVGVVVGLVTLGNKNQPPAKDAPDEPTPTKEEPPASASLTNTATPKTTPLALKSTASPPAKKDDAILILRTKIAVRQGEKLIVQIDGEEPREWGPGREQLTIKTSIGERKILVEADRDGVRRTLYEGTAKTTKGETTYLNIPYPFAN